MLEARTGSCLKGRPWKLCESALSNAGAQTLSGKGELVGRSGNKQSITLVADRSASQNQAGSVLAERGCSGLIGHERSDYC